MKKYLAIILGVLLSGCSQLTMLSVAGSTASLIVNNNALVKAYSGVDVATFMVTEKDIKTHVYEKATTVKNKINETFILEKPPMLEIEKRVLVALPIIEVKISQLLTVDDGFYIAKNFDNYKSKEDIAWEIESKGWRDIYYSSKFKLFY